MAADFFHAYSFKNQWLNFSLYFTNFMYKTKNKSYKNKVCKFIVNKYRLSNNENPIGGRQKNNVFLANGDVTKTTFIEVNKEDFIKFYDYKKTSLPPPFNTFEQLGIRLEQGDFKGNYMRAENPTSGPNQNITNEERLNHPNIATASVWNDGISYYFLKGVNDNDIFKYLVQSNVI